MLATIAGSGGRHQHSVNGGQRCRTVTLLPLDSSQGREPCIDRCPVQRIEGYAGLCRITAIDVSVAFSHTLAHAASCAAAHDEVSASSGSVHVVMASQAHR